MARTIHELWSIGVVKSLPEKEQRKKSGHRKSKDKDLLWREYFRDPSQWWDKRSSKRGPSYPDFRHKSTQECLWIDSWSNPSWVAEELRLRGLSISTHPQHAGSPTQSNPLMGSALSPFPSSQDKESRKRNHKLPHDAASAFIPELRTCTKPQDLHKGSRIHDDILKQGLLEKCSDALITMYAKCGALSKAEEMLEMHKSSDVSSWTALIAGYTRRGRNQDALSYFKRMQCEGLSPNPVTFACILKACGTLGAVEQGKQIHDEIARQGLLVNDIVLGTTLVDMYAKCGALAKAERVLEELPFRDVVCWSALITAYAQHGEAEQALSCFERMQHEKITPNAVTFSCVLKACGALGAIDKGAQIHDEVARQGLLENNIVIGNALVDMYAKCGALAKAHRVLEKLPSRDVVSWTALIGGYAQQGKGQQALACFEQMQREGVPPNAVTFACTLKACGTVKAAVKGKQIHDEIARQGLLGKVTTLGTALVDMYAMCGALEEAQRVLDELPSVDVVCWNALITGYAQEGQGEHALNCFERMQHEGIPPNAVTYASVLKACSTLGDIDMGAKIHNDIDRLGLLVGSDIVLGTALVDMYAKCGALAKAQQVLEELPSRDVVSWNALITGYTQQGQGEQALNCFDCMQQEGIFPNAATFLCVLNVCCHLGLVEDGHMYFVNMSSKYGVTPNLEVYTCMIDLFGRAGHLEKAVKLIQEMPSSNYSPVWHTLLSACQKWGDVNVGRWAFEKAVQVDQSDGVAYVLMANIYAAAGMQEKAKSIEAMGREKKASQVIGYGVI